ncbi:MAG: hypothetical protein Q9188_003615 [Gyalolechia gomerana]
MASDTASTMTRKDLGLETGASRDQLLKSLQGRSLHIPDLQAPLAHWPQYINPQLERLRQDVDETLRGLFPADKRLEKIRQADPALFGASWWPYASYEALKMATYLSIWISSLVSDLEAAQKFREETIKYIQKCLTSNEAELDVEPPSSAIIEFFQRFGPAIAKSITTGE